MKIKILLLLCVIIALPGCDSDEDPIKGEYQSGVLVANEGGFLANNATVTYFNPNTDTLSQNIFKNAGGLYAGDVLQSISLDGDRGYLVLNGSNAIEIVDHNTFQSIATFTDPELEKPRYLQVVNGKAYISVWGEYDSNFSLIDSYILVVDIKTLTVDDKIDTDEGTENLLLHGSRLFASNYNYGASKTVAVINTSNNTLVDQIELAEGPAGMVIDVNNKLWVITTGTFSGNDGKLFRIDPSTLAVEDVIDLNINPSTDLTITPDKKSLVYGNGNSIYKISITATEAPSEPWIEVEDLQILYALDVNPENGDVYIGDALDYSSPGKIYVYHADGSFKETFESGINPTQVIFK
jgi:hypothetical protein